ncbi:unnamed protein product [Closterium sp. Naga37s-1]|nr:unnamed protein product [Closterium sp. Naga37s-1]
MVKRPKTGQQVRSLPPRVSACLSPLPPSPLPPRPPIPPSPCPIDPPLPLSHPTVLAHIMSLLNARHDYRQLEALPALRVSQSVNSQSAYATSSPTPTQSGSNSTVLAHIMSLLNARHDYGLQLFLYSTVLAHIISLLNTRHDYGLQLFLLSIDEGITGYRDDSLETVKRNEKQYGIPLTILSYKDLYGWTMDEIVATIGRKNNCTFCGVFRRQALDRGAALLGADKLVTGHNADDFAETVLLNLLRGDVARLSRCIYSPDAYRGFAREFIKDLEAIRPRAILDIIKSAEDFRFQADAKMPTQRTCDRCGYISSQELCKACVLLEGLNRGLPRLGVSRTRRKDGQYTAAAGAAAGSGAAAAGDGGATAGDAAAASAAGAAGAADAAGGGATDAAAAG